MSKKKIHLITASGQDITDEWWAESACGFTEYRGGCWRGTFKHEEVTCKNCQNKMSEALR